MFIHSCNTFKAKKSLKMSWKLYFVQRRLRLSNTGPESLFIWPKISDFFSSIVRKLQFFCDISKRLIV